jgi:hypothetical protein
MLQITDIRRTFMIIIHAFRNLVHCVIYLYIFCTHLFVKITLQNKEVTGSMELYYKEGNKEMAFEHDNLSL